MTRQRKHRLALALLAAAALCLPAVKLVRRTAAKHRLEAARVEIAAGNIPRALSSVRRAVDWDPEYANARFMLGNVLLLANNPREAVRHLEAALAQLELPEVAFDLGLAYSQLGEAATARRLFNQAEPRLREAFRADPGDMKTLRMLGVLFLQTDRPRKALDCYIKLAAARPNDPGAIRVLDEIMRKGLPKREGKPG